MTYWGLRDYGIAGQLGLERTPEEYVANMVAVFREVWLVLRDDGTLWLNLGDSYAGSWSGNSMRPEGGTQRPGGPGFQPLDERVPSRNGAVPVGLKPKDLVGIPWAVARALQSPYYSGRIPRERDRVWLAAMIDGEGTICGFDHDRADGNGHRSGVHVAITNTSPLLLDEAARIWPTSRSEHQRPHAGHLGTKLSWRWLVHGIENKLAVLCDLYPYLIAKRQQAVVAYSLLLLMADAKRLGHSPQKDAVLAKRAVLTRLLSDLNHQRHAVFPDWLTEPPSLLSPGWYLRSAITWCKRAPVPESIKDRPTSATEMIFLLAKSERYFYDNHGFREASVSDHPSGTGYGRPEQISKGGRGQDTPWEMQATRNMRNFWLLGSEPYPDAHFAVFPSEIPRRAILLGTSERGCCPKCGAGWRRVVEISRAFESGSGRAGNLPTGKNGPGLQGGGETRDVRRGPVVSSTTTGWEPGCDCGLVLRTTPAIVLDPFAGSGTVGAVCHRLGRRFIGTELKTAYCALAAKRTAQLGLI